jgi:hypothetical protein
MAIEPCPRGEGDRGEQDLVLGLEPGHCLPVIGRPLRSSAVARRGQSDRLTCRNKQEASVASAVQIVVEDTAGGGGAAGLAVDVAGLADRVGAEQVVASVSAGDVLGEHLGTVGGRQPGQLVAAGDDDQAGGAGGQQRAD